MFITILIFVFLFFLDQFSKLLAEHYINVSNGISEVKQAIPNFLYFTKEYNTGASFSLFSDHTIILVIISAIATILLAYIASKNDWKNAKLSSFAITMALAGCVGNFYDRLVSVIPGVNNYRPGVVDMIIFKPFDAICEFFHLGTTVFNVADSFLVVGLIIFAIDLLFFADRRKNKNGKNSNN
ncbi:MAG: signal peptidase II [Anaeroplasma sp.]